MKFSKIVFSDLPMRRDVHSVCYASAGTAAEERSVMFPVNAVLAKKLQQGDRVKIVFLSKETSDGYSKKNEARFREEIGEINRSIGARLTFQTLSTPFIESRDIHEQLLRAIIGELEDGAEIICDVTYGPKPLPIVLFLALSFAEKFFGCKIGCIAYGKMEFVEDGTGSGKMIPKDPVLYDLSPLYYLNSVVNELSCSTAEDAVAALDVLLTV